MTVTSADIQAFHRFAQQRLSNGGADSMQQLLQEWLDDKESAEVVQAVLDGEANFEAGDGQSVADAVHEVRQKLGWQ